MAFNTSPRKNKTLLVAAIMAIPFFGVTALMVTAGSGQIVPPPVSAKSHTVDVGAIELQDSYIQARFAYGRIEAAQRANAGFELAGTLTQVLVDEGDLVVKGQLLAKLDTDRLDARMLELNAALQRAKSQARLAMLSEKRIAELVRKKLESGQRLDEVREATVGADAAVDEIQARMDSLRVELSKSELKAPFDAEILSRQIDQGTVVPAGQTVFTLQQNKGKLARIALAANDAFEFAVGDKHLLDNKGKKLTGQITSIAKQRRLDTRTVDVIFSIEDNTDNVLPGDLVALAYQSEVNESGVWVVKSALNSGVRGLWTLFVVPQEGEQQVTAKSVELLFSDETRAFVRGALKPTDMIVLNGAHRLVPNQLVVARQTTHNQFAKVRDYE